MIHIDNVIIEDFEEETLPVNKIIHGNALDVLRKLPSDSVDCVITSPPYWCLAEGHEILTYDGWKDVSEIKVGDIVLSVNPETMELEWVRVTAVDKWYYKGEMIHFKGKGIDLLVTPNHRMFVYYKKICEPIKEKQKDSRGKWVKSKVVGYFVEAKEIRSGYITPKTGWKWKGRDEKYFILPELKTIYNHKEVYYPPKKIKMEDWLAFFGLWLAEGSVRGSNGGKKKVYEITIKQKEPKASKVRTLLRKLSFKHNEYQNGSIVTFSIVDPQLHNYLKQFGNSHTKYIPREIKELPPRLLSILLDWYLFGDGTVKHGKYADVYCYSVSKKLKDDLAEIALKVGSNVSIEKDGNTLHLIKRKTVKLKDAMHVIEYKGCIYGIEVERNHTLCVRRNGKIIFTGNSKRDYGDETCRVWGGISSCEHEWEAYKIERKGGHGSDMLRIKGKANFQEFESSAMICKKCGAWYGQLGLEPTPELYVGHLIEIFREVKRVLKPHGNVFVVIDDTYSQSGKGYGSVDPKYPNGRNNIDKIPPSRFRFGLPQKTLCLVPELFAMKMVYEEGWILRNKIIWCKKIHIYKDRTTIGNAMPESVKDRLCHTWEYVYHFVKNPKYWYDLDSVRIPHKETTIKRQEYGWCPENWKWKEFINNDHNPYGTLHPLGANPGDVIQINVEPLKEQHYAPFPTKLVEFLIKIGCPQYVCKKCGKPRERIIEKNYIPTRPGKNVLTGKSGTDLDPNKSLHRSELSTKRMLIEHHTVGWTDCGCNAGWTSGIVLDPFLGSGTTSLVALQMGRKFIGIELNREYCEIAYKRIKPLLRQQSLIDYMGD